MLTKMSIRNFKGIKTCEVKDLRRINLFIGKNDSGKSTILEATYYMLQELSTRPQLSLIMSRRTDAYTGASELWFKYRTGFPIIISVCFDSLRLNWTMTWSEEHKQVSSVLSFKKGKTATGHISTTIYSGTDLSMTTSSGRGTLETLLAGKPGFKKRVMQYILNASFVDPTFKSRTLDVEEILSMFKIKGSDEKFGRILDDTYGKGKAWEFLPHPDRPSEKRLAIKESGKLTFFSDFGDGFRYGLGLLGTAMSLENTALFIEEIESHQHLGSLRELIKHLVNIARENNLQIFISTHSEDVWQSLARGVYVEDVEREKKEFKCFVIERDSKSGKATAEGTDDLQKITRALGRP